MNTIYNKVKSIGGKLGRKIAILLLPITYSLLLVSCNDWLTVKPDNEQVTTDYWQSKEDVEAVIASGYYTLRTAVPTIIKWGELRGGALYTTSTNDAKLEDFNMTSEVSICDYSTLYKVIGYANSVIHYAPDVVNKDNTYQSALLGAHLTEAYFLRAYCYLLLVKNYKEVPLVVNAYVDDSESFSMPKSTEAEIIQQIKDDCITALATGAAKGAYETEWQTKGRATKWAIYALLADVSLWNNDYADCSKYCDMILNAKDSSRPAFMTKTEDWYTMFYPGNSNESIFELNWSYTDNQETNNFSTSLFPQSTGAALKFTNQAITMMQAEYDSLVASGYSGDRMGRTYFATYVGTAAGVTTPAYLWKYYGNDVAIQTDGARVHQDANFIIYRVAEVMLMKAQAEAMQNNFTEAVALVNKIRNRAALGSLSAEEYNTQYKIITEILNQKEMEFMAEAKRWYDLLWLSRQGSDYKNDAINLICEGNQTTNQDWIRSILTDDYAWYMPLPQTDIENNQLLEQNPYYAK